MRAISGRTARIYFRGALLFLLAFVSALLLPQTVRSEYPRLIAFVETLAFSLGVGAALVSGLSWFLLRTTDTNLSFNSQHLPSRYRVVAWSIVAAALLLASLALWYTFSHGLAQL